MVKKDKDSEEDKIKSSLMANDYILGLHPELKDKIELENAELNKRLGDLDEKNL